jgi:CRISPR/Cas system-associated exonuclease Cas4 (RecB family)
VAILDQLRDGLHISISQIRTYLRCGRAYELRYVLGAKPAFKPVPLAFGTSFHAALGRFYLSVKEEGAPPPLQLVTEAFRDAWQREVEADVPLQADEEEPAGQGQVLDKGAEMLAVFYAHAVGCLEGTVVEAVEAPFSIPLTDPDTGVELEERLVGALDLLLKKGRRHQVVEFKTSARKYGEDQLRYDIQPTGYQLAAKGMGLGKVKVTYSIVTKARAPQLQVVDVDRSEEDEEEFQRVAVNVLRAVDAGAFPPVRGWQCRSCPHAHLCRPVRSMSVVEGVT